MPNLTIALRHNQYDLVNGYQMRINVGDEPENDITFTYRLKRINGEKHFHGRLLDSIEDCSLLQRISRYFKSFSQKTVKIESSWVNEEGYQIDNSETYIVGAGTFKKIQKIRDSIIREHLKGGEFSRDPNVLVLTNTVLDPENVDKILEDARAEKKNK